MRGKLSMWHEIQGDEMQMLCRTGKYTPKDFFYQGDSFTKKCPECHVEFAGTLKKVYCGNACRIQVNTRRQTVRRKASKEIPIHGA